MKPRGEGGRAEAFGVADQPKVHVFWDNSNIFHSALGALRALDRSTHDVRIEFENLRKLALMGRPLGSAYCVGSVPPEAKAMWDTLERKTGIKPELFERGAESGKEQAVDQALQVQMLRKGFDERTPQVAVLLTGDGSGFTNGVGFHADLQRLRDHGWAIEVLSWEHSCAGALKRWAAAEGVFIRLDDYIDALVFNQGTTVARKLDLRKRTVAHVTP